MDEKQLIKWFIKLHYFDKKELYKYWEGSDDDVM